MYVEHLYSASSNLVYNTGSLVCSTQQLPVRGSTTNGATRPSSSDTTIIQQAITGLLNVALCRPCTPGPACTCAALDWCHLTTPLSPTSKVKAKGKHYLLPLSGGVGPCSPLIALPAISIIMKLLQCNSFASGVFY